MAKRKTHRPASRARRPGAARGGRPTKPAARSSAARPKPARKKAPARAARRRASPKATKRASATKRTAAKTSAPATRAARKTARKATPRAAAGPTRATHATSSGRAGRTLQVRRRPAARKGGGPASTPPRRDYSARGSGTRLRQIERDRRIVEEEVPTPPSSLDLDRRPTAARAGRAEMEEALQDRSAAGPDLTAGDIDADWESAYSTGDEAPGGDMPTPDQAVVEEIGTAIGVEYADNEELKGVDKIEERDRHRWELDPASSEDYQDRSRERPERPKAKG